MTPDGKIHYLTKTLQPESDQTSRATFNLQEIYNTEQHVKQFHKDTVCTIQATGWIQSARFRLQESLERHVDQSQNMSYLNPDSNKWKKKNIQAIMMVMNN